MKKPSVTIIISHYESLPFLRTCLRQIEKYKHPDIEQNVLVLDQSRPALYEATKETLDQYNVDYLLGIKPFYSGYGIDFVMRFHSINSDYVCQLHADAFPISPNWLKLPITLMEENNFAFTGVLQFIANGTESIYPPTKGVFGMAQCFNIGKTEVYKEMSLEAGFTRFHNRIQTAMMWNNNDWAEWAKDDYNVRGSDDDVPAFFWEDKYRQHDKMSFGFTGKMGKEGKEPNFGTIIEDLVFHFGYHREGLGVMPQMGSNYAEWTRRINADYSDGLIEEMLAVARLQPMDCVNTRKVWDGTQKVVSAPWDNLNKRIEELKK